MPIATPSTVNPKKTAKVSKVAAVGAKCQGPHIAIAAITIQGKKMEARFRNLLLQFSLEFCEI